MNRSTINPQSRSWSLYVARCAQRGVSERVALAMVERHELVGRLERAGVMNITPAHTLPELRAVARELRKAGAL